MNVKITKSLIKAGLSSNESVSYLTLLESGQNTLGELAKRTRIDRSSVYRSLMSLVEHGLVEYEPKTRGSLYRAKSPKSLNYLVQEIEENKRVVEREIKDIVQELELKQKYPSLESNIVVLEGSRVIEQIWEEMLGENVESQRQLIRCDIQKFLVDQHGASYHKKWVSRYIQRRVKKKIPLKYLTKKEWFLGEFTSPDPKLFKEVRCLPGDFEFATNLVIYGDNVATHTLADDPREVKGVIIRDKAIAMTQRAMFDNLWEQSKEEK